MPRHYPDSQTVSAPECTGIPMGEPITVKLGFATTDHPALSARIGRQLKDGGCAAERAADELNYRTRRITKLFLASQAESPEGRKPDKKDVGKLTERIDPRPAYWSRLEKQFFTLLKNFHNDWDTAGRQRKPDDRQEATNDWRRHVKEEARKALEESIAAETGHSEKRQ